MWVEPGETVVVPTVPLVTRSRWKATSAGAPFVLDGSGIILGTGPVFSVSEWGFEGEHLVSGTLREGQHVLMGRSGFLTTFAVPHPADVPIEIGSGRITLQWPETREASIYVLPEELHANPVVRYWAERLFGEREGRSLSVGPLRPGPYVVIDHGQGVVHRIELQAGETVTLEPSTWMSGGESYGQ